MEDAREKEGRRKMELEEEDQRHERGERQGKVKCGSRGGDEDEGGGEGRGVAVREEE